MWKPANKASFPSQEEIKYAKEAIYQLELVLKDAYEIGGGVGGAQGMDRPYSQASYRNPFLNLHFFERDRGLGTCYDHGGFPPLAKSY